ncbi:MAG: hypothetical protein K8S27_04030 [Candidatus Omnitrophica bacterium]|nr:hypothetical protein [Candidatus Omnitrophota bacterium]
MKPVIQQEKSGCAIASSAAIAGITYQKAKAIANSIGIFADDSSLWSESKYICNILKELGFKTSDIEKPFENWQSLPACALLAIKWHIKQGKPYWHWAVYVRKRKEEYILDSSSRLKTNLRTDFGRINPKWSIKVNA